MIFMKVCVERICSRRFNIGACQIYNSLCKFPITKTTKMLKVRCNQVLKSPTLPTSEAEAEE